MGCKGSRVQISALRPIKKSCQWELVIDLANALLTVAQVAIGLAGFSSILVALSGKPHQWTPVDAFRIRNILAFTFQSVFLSLIPFVLSFFSLPPSTVWQASLLILVVATVADVLLILAGVYRLSASERAVLKTLVVSTVTVTLCIAAVVELIAVFGAIGPASGVFFLGLVVLLAVSTVLVARFLFARPAD